MEKFTSIESLKHIVANVRKHYNKIAKPFPTLNFTGTVKLHGTNASVMRKHSGKLQPQSRERILDVTSDNYGFAMFIESNKEAVNNLFSAFPNDIDVTLYGEWCGGNIQPAVALTQVPKHWVLFAVKYGVGEDAKYMKLSNVVHNNAYGIYNIAQIPSYHVEINFLSPEPASEILADLTLKVEQECPWATLMFNVSGIGEGLCWVCDEHPEISDLWFKTKGMLHKGNDKTKVPKIKIDDQKLASIMEVVKEVLPQWRLEQGISHLRDEGIPLLPQGTSDYLKWIAKDILKEEVDTIAASGFDWKGINGSVMQTARQYFLTAIQQNFEEV
jgi:hypothetical protein